MKVFIRRATDADAALLSSMALKIFLDTFSEGNRAEDIALHAERAYSPEIQLRELGDESRAWFIAEAGGEAAGFAMVGEPESKSCADFESPVELFRFYVDKAWHGRGVAGPLMEAVEEFARSTGGKTLCLGVWERNARAIRFYEKTGFRDVGSQPYLLGEDLQTDRVMIRVIA